MSFNSSELPSGGFSAGRRQNLAQKVNLMTTKISQWQKIALLAAGISASLAPMAWGGVSQPNILSATYDLAANQITITGRHFTPETGAPSVKLNSMSLTLASWTDSTIVAGTPAGLAPASYALSVNNGLVAGFVVALDPRFGTNTSLAAPATGASCTLGQIILTAGVAGNGVPATGQLLLIADNIPLYALLGANYGGDGITTFAVPDLRSVAPNGLTYSICNLGVFPSQN
jgi:hypothetical protein